MAYVCYDFNSAPICDELEGFNDCYVPCIKDILKHIKFRDMKPYVRYINNDLEFLYHFKIPAHFTNNVEMFFNDMIVRLSKRVNRLDINDFSYYNYTVGQYSGTCDYTDVTIADFKNRTECSFTFDFLTKELNFESYKTVEIRNAIIEAFKECYEDVRLYITDELLDEEIKELENTFASYSPDFFDAEEYKKMLKEFEDLKKEQDDLWKNKLLN